MASNTEHADSGVKLPVLKREKLILNERSYHWITERICGIIENRQPFLWWLLFIPCSLIALIGVGGGLTYLVSTGVGVWGTLNDARQPKASSEENHHADNHQNNRHDGALLPPMTVAGPRPVAGDTHRGHPPGIGTETT